MKNGEMRTHATSIRTAHVVGAPGERERRVEKSSGHRDDAARCSSLFSCHIHAEPEQSVWLQNVLERFNL